MKRLILLFFLLLFLNVSVIGQKSTTDRYQLSTHILDITRGRPAADVAVELEQQTKDGDWTKVGEARTGKDGRIANFLKLSDSQSKSNVGIYRLTFYTKAYFESQNVSTFYPFIEVVFELTDDSHYHVPITLSAYGYSTYRGS